MTAAPGHRFDDPQRNACGCANWRPSRAGADGRLSWWRFFEVLKGSVAFLLVRNRVGASSRLAVCRLFGLFGHPMIAWRSVPPLVGLERRR